MLVEVDAEHEGHLARLRDLILREGEDARLDEELRTAPCQRRAAARVPTIHVRPIILARKERNTLAVRQPRATALDAHGKVLEHRVRIPTDSIEREAMHGTEEVIH